VTDPLRGEIQEALGGTYAIERELGRGGMGAVYLARDLSLDRLVAIKVLPPELAVRHELRERFLRESRTTASFSHPHIVPVHSIVEQPQLLGYVMGYVEGESVTSWVARTGPLGARDAVRLLREVAWGLSYAHGRGIVHRDVKPDNILVERATGRAMVTDFGIARSREVSGLTAVGEVVGTPQFMSPEQAAGDVLDGRSDLYSLGVVAWYALTGKAPFDATSAGAVMAMHLTQPLPPLAPLRPDLPRAIVDVVERCLAKDPAGRFQTGEELVTAVDAVYTAVREVPPPMRLFHQRLNLVAFASFLLFLIGMTVGRHQLERGADMDALIFFAFTIAIVVALPATLVRDVRQLFLRGFSAGDVRESLLAIEAEGNDFRAQLAANKAYMSQLRSRRVYALLALLVAVAAMTFVLLRLRKEVTPGVYGVGQVGVAIGIVATMVFGVALVTLASSTQRGPPFGRLMTRLWTGSAGRVLFRLAAWRLPVSTSEERTSDRGATRRGPRTVLDSIEPARRRKLGNVASALTRLEAEAAATEEQVTRLEVALQEARRSVTPGTEDDDGARAAFIGEADAALAAAIGRRQEIARRLESIRIELLRFKSGLGNGERLAQILTS
jgi:eukaryotic-like serine/threonine-protein kinase